METKNLYTVKSDSNAGVSYTVNLESRTCSCPIFTRRLHAHAFGDPHRLCKHLIRIIAEQQIPDDLIPYGDDILWFAKNKASFTTKEKVIETHKVEAPVGSVQTLNTSSKRKYCYVDGLVYNKKISAVIPLNGGLVQYIINNSNGRFDLSTHEGWLPVAYRNLEDAIISWIIDEYNKVKNSAAPIATKIITNYRPIDKEFPLDCIELVKQEIRLGAMELGGFVHDEIEEYVYLKGKADRELIESVMSRETSIIYYSINNSKVYDLDISGSTANKSDDGIVIIFSIESDPFPKTYWFIEKAVINWLKGQYSKNFP